MLSQAEDGCVREVRRYGPRCEREDSENVTDLSGAASLVSSLPDLLACADRRRMGSGSQRYLGMKVSAIVEFSMIVTDVESISASRCPRHRCREGDEGQRNRGENDDKHGHYRDGL